MLNIYIGREDIDKQRYMFARIKAQDLEGGRERPVFLIVPDQFTLETERSAFSYMDVPAFINPIVLSMNRLAGKTLAEAGESAEHIDRFGGYMLLARLLFRNKNKLSLYQNLENSTAFISQLSEAIMSLKTFLVTPEALAECADAAERLGAGGALLGKKLRDVTALYTEYEAALAGGLPDGADIGRRFAELIPGSKTLSGSIVWIYGFDYFSPLHLKAIGAMIGAASEVNVVMTAEAGNPFFALTDGVIEALAAEAAAAGARADTISVEKDAAERGLDCSWLPRDEKPAEIAHIERCLFAGPVRPYAADEKQGNPAPALRFVAAQNYYAEAEAAAESIMDLIKNEGYRFSDILVVCNDQDRRAPAVQRVFADYGIEAFLDKRHEAGYNPVLTYITALPEILARGRRSEDVLAWIGTGLTDVSEEDAEELENYAERYGIRGSAWHRPLSRGADAYDEEAFSSVSDTVKYIGDMISLFAERFGVGGSPASERTARARTEGLRKFLEEDARLPEKIAAYAEMLEEDGFLEYAVRMRGIWDVALNIFSQIGLALGDVVTSAEEYATVLRVGFASVHMGVLPASSDCVTIGTMQRTRTGRVKAMYVLGANDGELPKIAQDDDLIDDGEKEILEGLGLTAFRREENLHNEEQLAIYKNLSKPTRLLYVSYTNFDAGGKDETKPSRVFDRLRALFPETALERAETEHYHPPVFRFESAASSLDAERLRSLLPSVLSPTAIEKYSRCPFAFLMDRGLRLKERRRHEIDSRGMGDVYHEALKSFGEAMNERGGAPANEGSAWNTATRAETDEIVGGIFRGFEAAAAAKAGGTQKDPSMTYSVSGEGALLFDKDDPAMPYSVSGEGVLLFDKGDPPMTYSISGEGALLFDKNDPSMPYSVSGEGALLFDKNDPAAVYRRARLESIVKDVCWALKERAATDGAERMLFETEFGYGGEFDKVSTGEEGFEIAGRIDRVDVLPGGRAKVLDYKSGSEKWNTANVKNGWQLQLMLYIKAIEKYYDPYGVSYFRIFEPRIDLSGKEEPASPADIREEVANMYRSDGIVRGDAEEGPSKTPLGEKTLSDEEFGALREEVDKRLSEIAAGLSRGATPAKPKQKAGGVGITACTYCNFRSICNYEDA